MTDNPDARSNGSDTFPHGVSLGNSWYEDAADRERAMLNDGNLLWANYDEVWDEPPAEAEQMEHEEECLLRWENEEEARTFVDLARNALGSERRTTAVSYLKRAALLGSDEAMLMLGQIEEKLDLSSDVRASDWYEKAAARGNVDAVHAFHRLWSDSRPQKLADLYSEVRFSSNPEVLTECGKMLEGINSGLAESLYRESTEMGDKEAPFLLGQLLGRYRKRGLFMETEIRRHYKMAATRGNPKAKEVLGDLCKNSDPFHAILLYLEAFDLGLDSAAAKFARLAKGEYPQRVLSLFDRMMESTDLQAKNDYANQIEELDHKLAQRLYRDVRQLVANEEVLDWTAIPPSVSGLPTTLLASNRGCADNGGCNPPRVVVMNDPKERAGISGNSFSVSIAEEPEVLDGANKLSEEEWREVARFIGSHRSELLTHWLHPDEGGGALFLALFPERYEHLEADERQAQAERDAKESWGPFESIDQLAECLQETFGAGNVRIPLSEEPTP